ncbi:N-acetylmannosaminyltransferase [Blastochloris viridis]|uniref:N-acetylmannosaminyltransferase n=1 Tax=Blastochloris viridis TaxID=1079 RepID=A0A182D175_BLAVI|nr:N-acetylmannosaminyltransferase [Blastochloris viridis]
MEAASAPRPDPGAGGVQSLLGVEFTDRGFDALTDEILANDGADAACRLVVTANVDHIVKLQHNRDLRQAYDFAWRATVDGAPLQWVAFLAGSTVPHRITGADLFVAVVDRLDPARHRPAFVASDEALAQTVREWLESRAFPADSVSVCVPPFGFESDDAASEELLQAVARCRPTHVFFGVGAPKSEIFAFRHRERFRGAIVMCIGAAIGFRFGTLRRAPSLARRFGFEWLWRLLSEPKRLFRRYLIESVPFCRVAAAEITRGWQARLAAFVGSMRTRG